MENINIKIEQASAAYGDKELKRALSDNGYTTGPRDKMLRIFDTYDIEVAFESGVEFALSKLCPNIMDWSKMIGLYRGNPLSHGM